MDKLDPANCYDTTTHHRRHPLQPLDDYLASVEQSGGRARVLEVTDSPRKVIGEIDGLVLTGGGDVDPVLYGEDAPPERSKMRNRDATNSRSTSRGAPWTPTCRSSPSAAARRC